MTEEPIEDRHRQAARAGLAKARAALDAATPPDTPTDLEPESNVIDLARRRAATERPGR